MFLTRNVREKMILLFFKLFGAFMKSGFTNLKRLKKVSPRPRGKSVIGKILFEYIVKVAKVLFKKVYVSILHFLI